MFYVTVTDSPPKTNSIDFSHSYAVFGLLGSLKAEAAIHKNISMGNLGVCRYVSATNSRGITFMTSVISADRRQGLIRTFERLSGEQISLFRGKLQIAKRNPTIVSPIPTLQIRVVIFFTVIRNYVKIVDRNRSVKFGYQFKSRVI